MTEIELKAMIIMLFELKRINYTETTIKTWCAEIKKLKEQKGIPEVFEKCKQHEGYFDYSNFYKYYKDKERDYRSKRNLEEYKKELMEYDKQIEKGMIK